jgi:DNA-binding transcriptional LysR family regulator
MIDPRLLGSFVAIADTGSFAAAAKLMDRTPSAISMQMSRLERMLGGEPLFLRQGRKMVMSEHGLSLLVQARRLLDMHQQVTDSLVTSTADIIRLGVPDVYAGALLPAILSGFAARHPEVEVVVSCESSSTLADQVRNSRIDLAIVTRDPSSETGEFLRRESVHWVGSPDLVARTGERVPLALFHPGSILRGMAIQAWLASGRSYRVAFSSPSIAGLLTPVRANLAITALPASTIPSDLAPIGAEAGLPHISPVDIALLIAAGSDSRGAVSALADGIRDHIASRAATVTPLAV